ncbi:MAG: aminopeptidase P family protein [Acetobacteraceae bacterium]|nr:aminopeptidase P family protein [Acetobacteraceae bacterium]
MNGHADRLAAVRSAMQAQSLHGLLVPRGDEHLSEYVPPSAARLAWLTGFTGSAGVAVVLEDRAAVFTDGRYTLQLAAETDPALWERRHIMEEPPGPWTASHAGPEARIGYDPMLMSDGGLAGYREAGLTLVEANPNPVDVAWTDRPAPPGAPALPYPIRYAGKDSAEKRSEIAAALRTAKRDAAVVTDPASIAWLLNIRGSDVAYTPFALGFLIIEADQRATLFMDPAKLPDETRRWLGDGVALRPRDQMEPALAEFRGKRVQVDAAGSPIWFAERLRAAGAEVVDAMDPCALPKACKNAAEQEGARAAHRRDAVAVCRFLHWLSTMAGRTTEIGAADQLLAFRRELPDFRGESFPAISGACEHGAIIHYRVTPDTDRPVREHEVYLIDSGAQYLDGTTDITRTVWTGPGPAPDAVRDRATRVLKGHIVVATTIFPEGVAGPHLDAFARRALWQIGLDYDHGTGHGVGSYLSVHEGPASLSRAGKTVPLASGMILSDEPGFYRPGEYGIRLENLLLVQPAEFPEAKKPFLRFEVLTLAPFDRRLIEPALLDDAEREWIDRYHARVAREIGPLLTGDARTWLETACAPLAD